MTFTNATGTFARHVTCDPLLNDTDFDRLSDYLEHNMSTDPRDPDTDDDGLTDYQEWRGFSPTTNPTHFDTDLDGLPDGIEITFGSDPNRPDTDAEGLTDLQEFLLGSNPHDNDTDGDGLSDAVEHAYNSSLVDPDSDDDFMFDGLEHALGTDPQGNDTDHDGLPDGLEALYDTDPLRNDTDGDDVPDGIETTLHLNPLSNDTDGDGLPDGTELEWGTNPWSNDTDRDGVPDDADLDANRTHVARVVLAADPVPDLPAFMGNLSRYTNVTLVTVDDLLANHTDAPHIVLVGPPDGNGAVGNLTRALLVDAGDVLPRMVTSDADRLAVRYGIWNATQTVVLLARPLPNDHLPVLEALRGKTVTIQPDAAVIEYHVHTAVAYPAGGSLNHTALAYHYLTTEAIDTVKATDVVVYAVLEEAVNATLHLTRYNATTTHPLIPSTGLTTPEEAVGVYLNVTGSTAMQDALERCWIQLYYREAALDRTGDGNASDPADLDETTLALYRHNASTGAWTRLTETLDGVIAVGVNTTDIELYGERYAGYLWADVTHLSLYALAAQPFNRPPNATGAYPSVPTLWPPNHKFVDVTILGVTDPDGDAVTITVTGISSDEPPSTPGGAPHTPDATGVGSATAWLRAERLGTHNGRVYVITFEARDGRGGVATGNVSVDVPHDQRSTSIDDGQHYDATTETPPDEPPLAEDRDSATPRRRPPRRRPGQRTSDSRRARKAKDDSGEGPGRRALGRGSRRKRWRRDGWEDKPRRRGRRRGPPVHK